MLTSPRIMIASAHGRGHFMAVTLQRLGFNVQLLDVTSQLGAFVPEDQDGPFGYFSSPRWHGVEVDFLQSFGSMKPVAQGFALWLRSGPWELQGPTSNHRAEALQQQERVLHFVKHLNELHGDRRAWIDKLRELDFDKRWLASLACHWMSNRSQWSDEAFQNGVPAALFESYFSRVPETLDLAKSLQWCAREGVVIVERAKIPDIAIENGRVQGLEVNADRSGFVRCHQLVWMLNSMETSSFSPRAFLKLYKGRSMEPEWCWLRYKVQFEESREPLQLADEFLYIEDLNLPWAHDNYAVFRRSENPYAYHVWLRLPYSQRFHREYLRERIEPLLKNIKERCSRLKPRLASLPVEGTSGLQTFTPPLFPVYRSENLAQPVGVHLKNLWFSHSEYWPSYSWSPVLSSQMAIVNELQSWWSSISEEQKQKELQL